MCAQANVGPMKHVLLSLVGLVLGSILPGPCASGQTQREMTAQVATEYKSVDARLNKVYQAVLADEDAAGKAKLVVAQRAWIAWRDAEAEYRCAASAGGSIQPMERYLALTELTRERIKMLSDGHK